MEEVQQRPQKQRDHLAEPCQPTGPWKRIHCYCFRLINTEVLASQQQLSYRRAPQALFSQTCPHWASISSSVTAQIFLPGCWFPWGFLFMGPHSSKLWFFVSTCLGLQFWGRGFALWLQFSSRCRKSSWFLVFQLFTWCYDRVTTSKLFPCQIGNWKLEFQSWFFNWDYIDKQN